MESGPAAFAGTAFALFGVALLLWTAARLRLRQPVLDGAHPTVAAALSTLLGIAALVGGIWCLGAV
ncbi:hypothetical protein [Streptomyces zagrosensis]|uniref:Uncharacterized protein n=1 Tax=Streptomyces zagrosensis TaxID=1042984 RepID=A0A7W9QG81_9ACTN|nr:hypothetical protein [Streptomyces zagrosensis]MBB5939546.1 hypothetical protein [Streptomyces zagrosensis]